MSDLGVEFIQVCIGFGAYIGDKVYDTNVLPEAVFACENLVVLRLLCIQREVSVEVFVLAPLLGWQKWQVGLQPFGDDVVQLHVEVDEESRLS